MKELAYFHLRYYYFFLNLHHKPSLMNHLYAFMEVSSCMLLIQIPKIISAVVFSCPNSSVFPG